ncbi:MAG TPA: multicopper oxidase domain-containing protein [Micromonosporaceae bacterium]|nr:multicopper oxidase domain-containing protein [Micromonosporaceae bacterium]
MTTAAARPALPGAGEPGPGAGESGRAGWHRRAAALPLSYLAGIVVVGFAHPFLPSWRWLAIHLLLLGAASNAILVWSAHFTAAVLHSRAPASRRGEAARLVVLNLGVVGVLVGGATPARWAGVAGAAAVFAAVAAHLWVLAARLRSALPARFTVTVRYYLAATVALLTGVPVGAWMLVVDDDARPRLLLFHAHVNLLGWVTLTVLGTLLTLWPTVLRTRMADGAVRAVTAALPTAVAGLGLLGAGLLAWWPPLAVVGLALLAAAVLGCARPAVAAARARPPASFAAWSIAAAVGWLLVAIAVDAWTILAAPSAAAAADRFGAVLVPLLVGFVAQVLVGALSYLVPMALGGGPTPVRLRTVVLDRWWPQRVAMANLALAVFLLPVPAYVRITTSLLVLAALGQFLLPAARLLVASRRPIATSPIATSPIATGPAVTGPAVAPPVAAPAGPRVPTGAAVGAALVLLAVLVGVAAQRVATPAGEPAPAGAHVPATGRTTTVAVTAKGMRFHPDRIAVPAGDRLVIELTNADDRRHDLALATGPRTAVLTRGDTARLDAGVIGVTVRGWCTLPGHRQAGMTLTITAAGVPVTGEVAHPADASGGPTVDAMADPGPAFTARDATAPRPPPASPAGRVHRVTLRVQEEVREVAPGVRQKLWTFNGSTPGPVLRGRVGDTFEVTLANDGSIEHGIDFHASALAPDGPMRPVDPGQSLTYRFTAAKAGVWMYHCSAAPMLHHIGNGMYGALIVDPPDLPAVAREYVLVQSELYLGGDAQPADLGKMQREQPDAVVFNGYVSQYVHRPLPAAAGQRVRIWVLNAGPSRTSAFHIVGAWFDTVYREGRWLLRPDDPGGAQVLDLAPATGGFVETAFAEPGHYPFLSHSMVDAERGARGVFEVASR